jgi:hypothetical protein
MTVDQTSGSRRPSSGPLAPNRCFLLLSNLNLGHIMYRKTCAILVAFTPILGIGIAQNTLAASLTVGFQASIAAENHPDEPGREGDHYTVSVNPNNPGYAAYINTIPGTTNPAQPFQRAFTEPVLGYSFVGGGTNGVLTIAQNSGGKINYSTTDTSFDSFAQTQRELWTTNDPGADLLNPTTAPNSTGPGYRAFGNITGTVDISGLETGTATVFYGAFNGVPTVSAVMRDLDGALADIVIGNAHNGDSANRTEYYVAEFDFENDFGLYDIIEYTWLADGTANGGNGRFGGTVLTGTEYVAPVAPVPEPASVAVWGLIGFGLVAIRRYRSKK